MAYRPITVVTLTVVLFDDDRSRVASHMLRVLVYLCHSIIAFFYAFILL